MNDFTTLGSVQSCIVLHPTRSESETVCTAAERRSNSNSDTGQKSASGEVTISIKTATDSGRITSYSETDPMPSRDGSSAEAARRAIDRVVLEASRPAFVRRFPGGVLGQALVRASGNTIHSAWANGHGCSSRHTSEISTVRVSTLQSIAYEARPNGSCRAFVTSKERERGRHDRAFTDRSFGLPPISVRVAHDWPPCLAQAGERASFEIATDSETSDSETDVLGPLIHNPGEGLGGPASALGD